MLCLLVQAVNDSLDLKCDVKFLWLKLTSWSPNTGDPPGTRCDARIRVSAREPLHPLRRETSEGNTRNL